MLAVTRAARPEIEACTRLLPASGPAPVYLTARIDGAFAGAAAVHWQMVGEEAAFPLGVHVLPPSRRRGVGRALVTAALRLAEGEADGVSSHDTLDESGAAAAFAAACGFAPVKRTLYFRMNSLRFLEHMRGLTDRLRERGRIPATIRTVPVRTVDPRELALLLADAFRTGPEQMRLALAQGEQGDLRGVDLDGSIALLDDDRLAGALLFRIDADKLVTIAANVVAPEWRRGWANAVLLEATTASGIARGSREFLFDCDAQVRDSVNLATRGGGVLTAVRSRYFHAAAS